MSLHRWSMASLAIAMAMLAPQSAVAQARPAEILQSHEQSIEADDGASFRVTFGTLRVPELRADGAGTTGTIDLAFVRVRRAEAPTRSAHFVLAGGPGDSGVNLVLGLVRRSGKSLAELFDDDIIGIDQRGTGRSAPNLDVEASYGLPLDRAGSLELWLPLMARVSRAVAQDFRARGVRLEAYNTRESAEDVEALRRALGYDKISLWGRSYGTHLALAVVRRYPERVERMVLVSPEGPDHTWKLPSQVEQMLRTLSAHAREPELLQRMRTVIGRLQRAPVTVEVNDPETKAPVAVTIGAFDVKWITAQALGDPRALATLPAAYRRMEQGDFSAFAPIALAFRKRLGIKSAMQQMMDLSSGTSPRRRARIEREAA
ncbi:MAG: alpha/beta fold hydrolase, partial [Gammaproteobacteria bacterium]|nr:alpha/beta fold hydrolase [Gammaproteobacteria bacterium]